MLPSTSDLRDVSESALKNPLPWDVVAPRAHVRLDRVEPYVSALREKSALRRAGDARFRELAEDIARIRKTVDAKSISLNEAERRQEIADAKALRIVREREAQAAVRPVAYLITLENASAPGLPAPVAVTKTPDRFPPPPRPR